MDDRTRQRFDTAMMDSRFRVISDIVLFLHDIAEHGTYGDPEGYRERAIGLLVAFIEQEQGPMDFPGAVSTAQGMCDRFGGNFTVYHYPSQPEHFLVSRPDAVPVHAGAEVDAELEPTPRMKKAKA